MKLFITACLLAVSLAQTGFCVERSDCQPLNCNIAADKVFCPCTCVPGTINSNAEHFTATFGIGESTPISDSTGVEVTTGDSSGNGGSGNAGSSQTSQPQVSYTVSRTGYICEEQDLELMHFPYFPGQLQSIQQCAENVAQAPQCGTTFFSGLISGTCGCVKKGFRCAENEGNDQHADVNIYLLTSGMSSAAYSGATPGMSFGTEMHPLHPLHPLNPMNPWGAMSQHPEFEPLEAEDIIPYLMPPGTITPPQSGPSGPYKLSKSASIAAVEKKSSAGVSTTVVILCATIPALVGFLVGMFIFRSKSGSSSDLTDFQQMTA